MASLPVRIAKSFLLKNRLIVSVNLGSSMIFTALVDFVVSALEEVFVPGVVLEGELSEKFTRALVVVDLLDLPLGVFEITLIEQLFMK